jgi:DNA-binding PadR family transcriptional regulator
MHGYQLLSALSELFGSQYRPSPGSVYPALDALEAEGLLSREKTAGRTTFHVTPTGAEALVERQDALAALEQRTGVRVSRSESLESAIAGFRARLAPIASRVDLAIVAAALDRAAAEIESRHRLSTGRKADGRRIRPRNRADQRGTKAEAPRER